MFNATKKRRWKIWFIQTFSRDFHCVALVLCHTGAPGLDQNHFNTQKSSFGMLTLNYVSAADSVKTTSLLHVLTNSTSLELKVSIIGLAERRRSECWCFSRVGGAKRHMANIYKRKMTLLDFRKSWLPQSHLSRCEPRNDAHTTYHLVTPSENLWLQVHKHTWRPFVKVPVHLISVLYVKTE